MSNKSKDRNTPLLKVVSNVKPADMVVPDPITGQTNLFEVQEELILKLPQELQDFATFMNNRLSTTEKKLEDQTEQNRRLANTLEKMIPKLRDQSVNHTEQDIVFGHLSPGEKADVAIADGTTVASEALYLLSTGEIAELIGNSAMTVARMGMILKDLGIYGDPKFHHTYRTTRKGKVQKYKTNTVDEVYKRIENPLAYGIPDEVVQKAINYIKPRGATNQ